ncbi:glycoside hydrolase family 3 N-terminal domain-containing protein [uncultured Cellulomonas sp.]|uniref:glycoside hydrolase family 3 N-terminal domain-containing protein n=1 Tax=uncultured Cellulomonas sp. TaxID=189682 RepID=UPI00261CE0FB|nr:glycoside hydrolase family 3 N-terminal domain-containing protein [uncultured Cellulomonas sp.]
MTSRSRSRSRGRGLLALLTAVPMALAGTGAAAGVASAPGGVQAAAAAHPWMDTTLTPQERSQLLLDAMTLAQKLQQLSGTPPEIVPELPECWGGRHVRGIPELQIPTLRITNGPVGVGQNDCVDAALLDLPPAERPRGVPYVHESSAKATALPSATTAAASFDPEVAGTYGDVIGTEMNNLALHVFEAPGVNMARLPILGRNFEYFGEDPYLAGVMAVAETKAVQDQGLIAMPKHYAANEQETNRQITNSVVDERTLHETYLLPFEMAVKDGDAASVMCAYNYLNGVPSCQNEYLLSDVLRDQWGFEGYVQSDFFATKSTVPTLLNGMDHMMPVPQQWAPELLQAALDAGEISVGDIDLALHRRYVQMFTYGIFDRPIVQTPIDYDAGGRTAYEIGTHGAVLLQNNGALPIPSDVRDVVVVGKATQVYAQQAVAGGARVGHPFGSGGGSSDVVPAYSVDPVEGLLNTLEDLGNTDAQVRLVLVDDANQTATIDGEEISFEAALAEVAGADSVVVMAGTISEEGADRATFSDTTGTELVDIGDGLDWYADNVSAIATVAGSNPAKNSNTVAMIKAVLGAGPSMVEKTALVLKDNAGVSMDPALVGQDGPSILEAWFPGQEDGNIVADLLFGVVNPSGKSPVTYPYEGKGFLDEIGAEEFPGVRVGDEEIGIGFGGSGGTIIGRPTVQYTEGVNIGYRWYDANLSGECAPAESGANPCVAFPFGHGLSYTDFEVTDLVVTPTSDGMSPVTVEVTVENTGDVAGAEVPQVYVSLPDAAADSPRRLVGFQKVQLEPGEAKQVEITIDPTASSHPLSVWDGEADEWTTPEGDVVVQVGTSSGDVTLSDTVTVDTSVPVTFPDVPATHDFAEAIAWLVQANITTGYEDGTFRPTTPISRQAMAAFVYRLVHDGADAPGCTTRPFPDVDVANQFCGEIAWMQDAGLTTGYADGTYRPTAAISRQAMAAFLHRLLTDDAAAADCTAAPFTDVSVGDRFCGEISWLKEQGLTTGYEDGTFGTTVAMSRQAMAAMLYRAVVTEGLTVG